MRKEFASLQEKLTKGTYEDFTIFINNLSGTQKTTLKKLIEDARKQDQSVILSFTPGPFKKTDQLPDGWMSCDLAKGCTPQLAAINTLPQILGPNTLVYGVNIHAPEYQAGDEGLLSQKAAGITGMISDPENKFFQELGLPAISVSGKRYFERMTAIIEPNGKVEIFELTSPVTPELAQAHIQDIIKHFKLNKALDCDLPKANTNAL